MNTDKKFTIILSAYQAGGSLEASMLNTELLAQQLDTLAEYSRAVGVYMGEPEQSFVVTTNSSSKLAQIKRLAFDEYKQECVLVRQNHKREISIVYPDKSEMIGKHFNLSLTQPKQSYSYTVVAGTDYYTVV